MGRTKKTYPTNTGAGEMSYTKEDEQATKDFAEKLRKAKINPLELMSQDWGAMVKTLKKIEQTNNECKNCGRSKVQESMHRVIWAMPDILEEQDMCLSYIEDKEQQQ